MEEVIVLDSDGEEEYFSQNLSINSLHIKEEIDDDDCSKGSDVDGADDDDDGKKAFSSDGSENQVETHFCLSKSSRRLSLNSILSGNNLDEIFAASWKLRQLRYTRCQIRDKGNEWFCLNPLKEVLNKRPGCFQLSFFPNPQTASSPLAFKVIPIYLVLLELAIFYGWRRSRRW